MPLNNVLIANFPLEFAISHFNYSCAVFEGCFSVRDNDKGKLAICQGADGFGDFFFGFCVEGGGGFVEEKHVCSCIEGSGYAYALTLSA